MLTGVLINTRGHPEQLTAVCLQLLQLALRPEMIRFAIRCDDDDEATQEAAKRIGKHTFVHLFTGPRPESLGREHNRMIREMEPCTYYHVLNDDVCPLTNNWEVGPIRYHDSPGARDVMCWDLQGIGAPDYPIVTRKWIEAAGGLFPEYFPFWFDDMTLACVACLVYGEKVAKLPLALVAKKKRTQRMREIQFWYSFYRFLEPERVAWAQAVADKLELSILYMDGGTVKRRPLDILRDRYQWISDIRGWEDEKSKTLPDAEKAIGDPTPPDPAYLRAKAYAEQRMAKHRLAAE